MCVGVFGGLLLDIHVHVHVHIGGCLALFYCPFEASVYGIEVLNHKHYGSPCVCQASYASADISLKQPLSRKRWLVCSHHECTYIYSTCISTCVS